MDSLHIGRFTEKRVSFANMRRDPSGIALTFVAAFTALFVASSSSAQTLGAVTDAPHTAFEERAHLSMMVGLTFPGRMMPDRVRTTRTGVGPVLRIEGALVLTQRFELGSYLSFSMHPITSISTITNPIDGRVLLASFGMAPKWRLRIGDWGILRIGAMLGLNLTSNELASGDRYPGVGFNFGPTFDLRGALTERLGIIGQLGFVSQIAGRATLPESVSGERNVSYSFTPVVFVAAGIDISY
jgi:hypothetical protein